MHARTARVDNAPDMDVFDQTEEHGLLRAAAIEDDGSSDVDALLADIAAAQQRAGRRVRGVVMTRLPDRRDCAAPMVLVDVDTRQTYLVSQALGRDSTACRADPQGFARASEVLRRAVQQEPDLVVSNRFGGLEAEGGGFRAELLEILASGLPLLTVVASRHVQAWLEFTGGADVLAARAERVAAWIDRAVPPRYCSDSIRSM